MSDIPWWQVAKAQSIERSKAKPKEGAGDSFLIVTEGTVSEPVYFRLLRNELELSAVTVRVQPGTASHPRHVIETARKEVEELAKRAKKNNLAVDEVAKYDQVWAVIDTDVATREGIWHEIVAQAKAAGVTLAYSSPCIEFWFFLHLKYSTAFIKDGAAAKALVKKEIGGSYSTNQEEAEASISQFLPNWPEAVLGGERARKHHEDANSTIPANPSTEVARLVRALNNAAPQHLQRL